MLVTDENMYFDPSDAVSVSFFLMPPVGVGLDMVMCKPQTHNYRNQN